MAERLGPLGIVHQRRLLHPSGKALNFTVFMSPFSLAFPSQCLTEASFLGS